MSLTRIYLGNPAGPFGMQALPAIRKGGSLGSGSVGMSPTMSRSAVTHALSGGGIAVTKRAKSRTTYTVQWQNRGPADVELMQSFYDGRQGAGPFCLIDPSWANMLSANTSSMGAVIAALPEWAVNTGQTLAQNTAIAAPTGTLSGVAAWTGAGSGSLLYLGATYGSTDASRLPPVLTGVAHTFSIWARTATGTSSVKAQISYGIGGSAPGGVAGAGSATTLTTTWQQLSVTIASTFSWAAGSQYALPQLLCSTASSPVIELAGAAFVYDSAALTPFGAGIGVPRVVLVGDTPSAVGRPGLRDYAMQLAEI